MMTNQPPQLTAQLQAAAASISAFTAAVNVAAQVVKQAAQYLGSGQGAGGQGGGGNLAGLLGASAGGQGGGGYAAGRGVGVAARALAGGAGISAAANAGLKAASQALGPAGMAFQALADKASGAAKWLEKMSVEARKFHQELANVSPAMAAAEARRNVAIILRQREQGNRLAGAASALNEAEQQKEEAKKELGILEDRVKTALATFWEKVKAGFYAPFNNVAGKINKLIENTDPNRPLAADEWAQKMAEEDRKWRDDWHRRHDQWEPAGNDRGVPGMGVGGGDAFK
jgi:hypothetical protein